MSTTSNVVTGVVLTSALVVGGIALSPEDSSVASDAGVADAGQQPLVGNFYLRFPDEATFRREIRSTDFWQANVELEDAGPDAEMVPVEVDSGTVIMANMGHAFDILGTLVVPRRDADGGIIADGGSETLDGYHVNFSGILPDEWAGYIVDPKHPVRKMR
jgi:hypothetical protein